LFIGDVRRPKVYGSRAVLVNPIGNLVEDVAAEFPLPQVRRAAHLELAAVVGSAGGEDVPGIASLDDRGVVRFPEVAGKGERPGLLRMSAVCGGKTAKKEW
jgi:hypothetical protein